MLNMNLQSLLDSQGESVSMVNDRILVVDDEEDLAELVRYNLTKEGYQVTCVGSGEQALGEARAQVPDLIVLDLLLPKVDGLDVCKQLKSDPKTQHIPIVMLTAKSEEVGHGDRVWSAGPTTTSPSRSARVCCWPASVACCAAGRKPATDDDPEALRISNLLIHPGRHEVLVNGTAIDLTFTEFRLLHFLARKPGWAFSRSQIVDAVKGEDYPVTERSVDVQVVGLRKKLGALGTCIETVRGVGYRFKE